MSYKGLEPSWSIEIENLTKYYGKHLGVKDLSMSVRTGDFYGFIGPNGAGKTTAIKTLVNLLIPTSGEVRILGANTAKHLDKIKDRIGFMPSEVNLYEDLTVEGLLQMNRSYYKKRGGQVKQDQMKAYEKKVIDCLEIDVTKRFKALSLGNRKKVGFLMATAHEPEVLILDEPTSGLDPLIQDELMKLLSERHQAGTTILLSSHTLSEVENNCITVGLIKKGRMFMQDDISRLKRMNLKHVEVYIDPAELQSLLNWADRIGAVQSEPARSSGASKVVLFKTAAAITDVMQTLSQVATRDVNIFDPTLEDLFMHYYQQEEVK